MHADDIAAAGLAEGQRVDITSHHGGERRTVHGFRLVAYDMPRRTAATYFPEGNALVALDSFAEKSRTPAYKSVVITIAAAA
jgi:anaerobic selenocysteine-containing dehydrogenase